MKTLIVIPARYGSTRFPGKPLAKIAGKEMLLRVWENAQKAASKFEGCQAVVATDDERIMDFCRSRGIDAVMTSVNCPTGTDRVIEAAEKMREMPEFVVNLQGDNPICPTWFVEAVINEYYKNDRVETVTPVVNLSWEELDKGYRFCNQIKAIICWIFSKFRLQFGRRTEWQNTPTTIC
jgi:3-deoxy-manno-octulosonate cytidylyltransferase (CMP-KDO synthetase)